MCGNFGDPAAHPQSLDFCEGLKSLFPRAQLQLNTNGSLQKKEYWQSLGRLFRGEGDMLHFALDGLGDTHSIYRRGTQFERILENATAAIRSGANVAWVFLVFEHNEHQVEEAREMARTMGFRRFTSKYTKRFLRSQRMEVEKDFPVINAASKEIYKLHPPLATRYQNAGLVHLKARQSSGESLADSLKEVEIECKAQREKSLYISAEGLVFPCCWTGAALYPNYGEGRLFESLDAQVENSSLSLYYHDLNHILEGEFYRKLEHSFTPRATNRLNVCSRICGKGFETFEEQFEHHSLHNEHEDDSGILPFS